MSPRNWTRLNGSAAYRLLRFALLLTLFFATDLHRSASAQVAIPDTPAGHALSAWLNAFNSGDKAAMATYIKTIDPTQSLDNMISFHEQTNGFQLLSIVSSEPRKIHFVVKENAGPVQDFGNLVLKAGAPPTVESLSLVDLPPGVTPVDVTLDSAMRQAVIDGVKSNLLDSYVDLAVAQKIVDALVAHQSKNDYAAFTDGDLFAQRLTNDLQAVSHDKHLWVGFNPFKSPPDPTPTPEDDEHMSQQIERDNCAFEKVALLPGNIGYIKFNAFEDPAICGATLSAAMGFVAYADALIVDLRENGGGDPVMVSMVASYLFDKPTHLNDLYTRKSNTTQQYWTSAYTPVVSLRHVPVYVLTAGRTFSGAEEFSYDLKTQKRATIIGETTGGGAHPVSGHRIADYFVIGVPWGAAINPITKTNWEGTGVEPDIKVPAADALATAQRLALAKTQGK